MINTTLLFSPNSCSNSKDMNQHKSQMVSASAYMTSSLLTISGCLVGLVVSKSHACCLVGGAG